MKSILEKRHLEMRQNTLKIKIAPIVLELAKKEAFKARPKTEISTPIV